MTEAYTQIKTLKETAERCPLVATHMFDASTRILENVSPEERAQLLSDLADDVVSDTWRAIGTQKTHMALLDDTICVEGLLDAMCGWRLSQEPSTLLHRYFGLSSKDPATPIPSLDEMCTSLPKSEFVWARRERIEHMLKDVMYKVSEAHHQADEYHFGRTDSQAVDDAFEKTISTIRDYLGECK